MSDEPQRLLKRQRLIDPAEEENEIIAEMAEMDVERERMFMLPWVQDQIPSVATVTTPGLNLISDVTDELLLMVCSFLPLNNAIRFVTTSKQHIGRLMLMVMDEEKKRFHKAMRVYEARIFSSRESASLCFLGICIGCNLPEWRKPATGYAEDQNRLCDIPEHKEAILTLFNRYTIPLIRAGKLPCDWTDEAYNERKRIQRRNRIMQQLSDDDTSDEFDESLEAGERCATCPCNITESESFYDDAFTARDGCTHVEGVCYDSYPWRAPVYVNPWGYTSSDGTQQIQVVSA